MSGDCISEEDIRYAEYVLEIEAEQQREYQEYQKELRQKADHDSQLYLNRE